MVDRKFVLALLLFASFASASSWMETDSITGCISNSTEGVFVEQGALIGIVILFTIALIGAAYMLGSVFSNTNWVVFAKDEIYHLGFSILFLVGFSGILISTCVTVDGFFQILTTNLEDTFGGLSCSMSQPVSDVAYCYIEDLKSQTTDLAESHIDYQISEMMDSTFAWSFSLPLMNAYTMSGDAYKRIRSSQYEMIFSSFLVPALVSIGMQQIMISFISENIIQWLLPIAFLLRIFIPTRQMGDLLIALCVGVYVVIPMMYVFELAMYDVVEEKDCTEYQDVLCDRVADVACGSDSLDAAACENSVGFWQVGRVLPFAFFFPNLTIVIFVAFMSAVHKGLRAIG